jgi:hypothetical protein
MRSDLLPLRPLHIVDTLASIKNIKMILLQIRSIQQVEPIKWESKDLSGLNEGQRFVRFMGDHPDKPEYGSIVLSTQIVNGQFDEISQVLFIGDDAQEGKLVNYKKQLLGGYKVEVLFDTIFGHGLKYCANNFIQSGGALVGLTESEKKSLHSIETQKKLLSLLADFIIPNKKELILNFARTGFLCLPNDESDTNKSHYLGCPKHEKSKIIDSSQNDLYHLSTLNLKDFDLNQTWSNNSESISFYIKINDTENGWPEEKDDFKVLQNNTSPIYQDSETFEQAINFGIKPILDLPGYDHSLINHHNFTDDDRDRFEALRSVFMQLIIGDEIDEEANKILGYPDSIQNCVSYEAERIFNKREYSDEIYEDATKWCLLLQVSPYCKWFKFFDEFGDGSIYYMIRKQDLELGDFTNCQVVVQNT